MTKTDRRRRLTCQMLPCLIGSPFFSTPAMADESNDPRRLAGEYRGERQKLTIQDNGRYTWEFSYFPAGSDAGMSLKVLGSLKLGAEGVTLSLDKDAFATAHGGTPAPAGAEDQLPSRLHPVEWQGVVFLLDEKAINAIANQVNVYGRSPVDASPYLHRTVRGVEERGALRVEPGDLLPKSHAHRILAAPLRGKVLTIDEVTEQQVNVAGWMRPPIWRTQHAARLVIDQGASQGVFEGMLLHVGSARQSAWVHRALPDRCEARMVWVDVTPQVGDVVSSSAR